MRKYFNIVCLNIVFLILILSSASLLSCNTVDALLSGDKPDFDNVLDDVKDVKEMRDEIKEEIRKLIRSDFTDSERYYVGRATSAYIFGQYELYDDEALTEYVNQVGSTVALASNKSVTFKGYRFAIFDDETPNAFATPGGMVLISLGMIKLCETEDELASVLAHEVEHIVRDHPMKAVKKETRKETFKNEAILFAEKKSEDREIPEWMKEKMLSSFENVLNDVSHTFDNGYERKTEFEADTGAVMSLHLSGYSFEALKSIISKLPETEGSKYGKNHPPKKRRIKSIDLLTKRLNLPPHTIIPNRTERFETKMSEAGLR